MSNQNWDSLNTEQLLDEILKKISHLEQGFDDFGVRFDEFSVQMHKRFDQFEQRLDSIVSGVNKL